MPQKVINMKVKTIDDKKMLSHEEVEILKSSLDLAVSHYKEVEDVQKTELVQMIMNDVDGKIDEDRLLTFLFASHLTSYISHLSEMGVMKSLLKDVLGEDEDWKREFK